MTSPLEWLRQDKRGLPSASACPTPCLTLSFNSRLKKGTIFKTQTNGFESFPLKKKSSKQKFTEPAVISKEASPVEGGDPASRFPSCSLQLPGALLRAPGHRGLQCCSRKHASRDFPLPGTGEWQGWAGALPDLLCSFFSDLHPAQQEWAHSLWGSEEQKRT